MREVVIGAAVLAAALAVLIVAADMSDDRRNRSATMGSSGRGAGTTAANEPSATEPEAANAAQRPPRVDYLLDLNTGVAWPLPKPILATLGSRRVQDFGSGARYAVSPDQSRLAFVGEGEEGHPQIFIANLIDGSGIRQVSHDLRGARSPDWSPHGPKIAYEGYGTGTANLYVLNLDTGYADRITGGTGAVVGHRPQFTPHGSSLVYTGGTDEYPELRTVPTTGGRSKFLFPLSGGLQDSGNGSLSPDGSLVTFVGSGNSEYGHCGPCRWLAHADGTHRRVIRGCLYSNPSGTWSPNGRRIVCANSPTTGVAVVDANTRLATPVTRSGTAIWIDPHTLLVET